jgi:hypothetical protein
VPYLHVASIFLGSFLLFLVQPLAGRILLPSFGGSPAVWTTALVFFQVVLLLGYLYAHLLPRVKPAGLRAGLHLGILALPFLFLPPRTPSGLDPSTSPWPEATLLLALAAAVGAPFFVLATNSSLVQLWYAGTRRPGSDDPYWLYAASNVGSLLALLAYPFLLEPLVGLPGQGVLWAAGYGVFALLTAAVAVKAVRETPRRGSAPEGLAAEGAAGAPNAAPDAAHDPTPSVLRRAGWVARAAVGSSLLLGLTTRITTDVAPLPFLWVAPLALYLVTYILAFGIPHRLRRASLTGSAAVGVGVSLLFPALPPGLPLTALVAVALWTLFFGALVCHRDLAADRPAPRHLTEFYLWLSAGGALGGVLNSIVAPLVFDSLAEVPLTLMALLLVLHADPASRRGIRPDPYPPRTGFITIGAIGLLVVGMMGGSPSLWAGAAAVAVGGGLLVRKVPVALTAALLLLGGAYLASGPVTVLAQERSFFGVHRVRIIGEEMRMIHGTTVHGGQSLNPVLRRVPRSYYHPSGPLGATVAAQPEGARIGIVGLGAGALAVLSKPGQEVVYHEIDPVVEALAREHFTFLDDAPGEVRVLLGDGRLTVARQPEGSYDLLIIDAFSSGAIPVHLLTEEALDLFLSRVRPGGVVLLHLSNRYADLRRVVRGYAEHAGRSYGIASWSPDLEARREGADPTVVAAVARDPADLAATPGGHRWTRLNPDVRPILWTDARSDLLGVLRR